MKLRLRLTQDAMGRYEHGVIALGTSLVVFAHSDVLFAEAYDDPSGWYERLPSPALPALTPVAHDLYAFCGQVREMTLEQDGMDITYFAVVDCGLPITLVGLDPAAQPGEGALGRHVPEPGAWLSGMAHLMLDWAETPLLAVGEPVQGVVHAIERLVLRPGPNFGQFYAHDTLPLIPPGPDAIFITLHIA